MKINCKYSFCFIWDIFLEGNFTYADVIKGGEICHSLGDD